MSDLISRQDVLKLIRTLPSEEGMTKGLLEMSVKQLPSAQPEIIYCHECKYSDTYPTDADNDMPLKCLEIRYGGVEEYWFCEHAERREEE